MRPVRLYCMKKSIMEHRLKLGACRTHQKVWICAFGEKDVEWLDLQESKNLLLERKFRICIKQGYIFLSRW